MTSPILVTGGTGTLGRLAVARLRDAGSNVRMLSRHHEGADGIEFVTGDLAIGKGIEAAVDGVDTIVHCAGSAKGDEEKARNLVWVASQAGASHLVYISVVGADCIPIESRVDRAMFGYFGSKLAAERIVADAARPPVSRSDADGGTADGKAAGDTGPGQLPVPADRRRRGGCQARRTDPRQAVRPGAGHGRTADIPRS